MLKEILSSIFILKIKDVPKFGVQFELAAFWGILAMDSKSQVIGLLIFIFKTINIINMPNSCFNSWLIPVQMYLHMYLTRSFRLPQPYLLNPWSLSSLSSTITIYAEVATTDVRHNLYDATTGSSEMWYLAHAAGNIKYNF